MEEGRYNSEAWDEEVGRNNFWTRIVPSEAIENARQGKIGIWITPESDVPPSWLGDVRGKRILLFAGGGGQQTPILAAAGADVVTVDISPKQIEQDRKALEIYNLEAELHVADMRCADFLKDDSFDMVICPHSVNFISSPAGMYREAWRVLKENGKFLFGACNPVLYMFDDRKIARKLVVKYTLPFSDEVSLGRKELERRLAKKDTVEFSHTLDSIIGDLLKTGFSIRGFYSDGSLSEPVDSFVHDSFLAFLAVKDRS